MNFRFDCSYQSIAPEASRARLVTSANSVFSFSTASCARPGPHHGLEGGVDLGVQPPDPVRGLVDLASQVQVETSQHAQRCGILVRGADGSQGVRHGPGGLGDDGRVLRVGLGAARRQVGDAAHRQSGQVAHGDAHVLSHRHRQGPDGGRLIDHHQHLPLCLQALVDLTQPVLVVG